MLRTLSAIAGAKSDASSDGEDLSAALLGTTTQRTKPLFREYGRNTNSFTFPEDAKHRSPNVAIRDGKWKLLANADGSNAERYDMIADANETKNLASDEPEIAARLREALLNWRRLLP